MTIALFLGIAFSVIAIITILGWLNYDRSRMHHQTSPMTCRCGYKAETIWDLADHLEGK